MSGTHDVFVCMSVCMFVKEASLSAIKDSCRDTHLIEMNRFLDSGYRRRGAGECGVEAGGLVFHHTRVHKTCTRMLAQWLINAP